MESRSRYRRAHYDPQSDQSYADHAFVLSTALTLLMTLPPREKNGDLRQASETHPQDTPNRLKLALARAAAADRWRSHVEATALIHRQRALQIEQDMDQLRRQASRLQHHVNQLNYELGQRDELLKAPSIRYACLQRLRRSPLGPMLWRIRNYFLASKNSDTAPEAIASTQPPAPESVETSSTPVPDAASLPKWLFGGGATLDSTKPTLLFITAEASDTEFGRHTIGVVQALARYANVLVWHLGLAGPLTAQFKAAATGFLADPESGSNYDAARQAIAHMGEQVGTIDCAIAAGLECRSVLPGLAGAYIPTLLLVDDDAVYVHSVYLWQEVLFWSTHTLFRTPAAREQILKICSYLNPANVSVLASPYRETAQMPAQSETTTLLSSRMRFEGRPSDGVVVGWGTTGYTSGLDAFVACADAVRRRLPKQHIRFVWLAQTGSTPEDTAYAFTVQQHIERWGLVDYVAVIYEPIPVGAVLSLADLLLFPARSDMLEHPAIEALQHGTPLIAFEQATVLAKALQAQGFGDDCLVRYADVNALTDRAVALLENGEQRATLGQRLATADWSAVTSDTYAQTLMACCSAATLQLGQERLDEAIIQGSGQLRPEYLGEIIQHRSKTRDCSDARLYIKGWNAGLAARKPCPGFHPAIYADMHKEISYPRDSFAAYLSNGCPEGPWRYPIILSTPSPTCADSESSQSTTGPFVASSSADTVSTRIALHVHAYYPDMLPEFLDRIRINILRPDLFISVRDEDAQTAIRQMLSSYDGRVAAVDIVPNLGRDIGPFLSTFGQALIDGNYDFIGHVHTKRSSHADRATVDRWRNFMLENVLGGEHGGAMMDTVINQMQAHESWGIAFPDDPFPVAWDGNRDCAEILARNMNLGPLPDHFNFPAGNMFWIRPAALQPFVELGLLYDDYPPEPLPIDGTFLHALERLFGVVPRAMGMECALISVSGFSR